jgi:hypothetical protein
MKQFKLINDKILLKYKIIYKYLRIINHGRVINVQRTLIHHLEISQMNILIFKK